MKQVRSCGSLDDSGDISRVLKIVGEVNVNGSNKQHVFIKNFPNLLIKESRLNRNSCMIQALLMHISGLCNT